MENMPHSSWRTSATVRSRAFPSRRANRFSRRGATCPYSSSAGPPPARICWYDPMDVSRTTCPFDPSVPYRPLSSSLHLCAEGQRHAVGPAEAVLIGILAAAGLFGQIHDVVLLRHLACGLIRPAVEREPSVARRVREAGTTVTAHAFHRDPLERRPSVGRVPLLA